MIKVYLCRQLKLECKFTEQKHLVPLLLREKNFKQNNEDSQYMIFPKILP